MKPEHRQQVEQLCHSALGRKGGQHLAFLAEAYAGDGPPRSEVETLDTSLTSLPLPKGYWLKTAEQRMEEA